MNGTYKENRMNSQRPAARRQTVNMRNVYVASFFAAAALLLVLSMFLFFNVSEIKIEGVTLYEQDQILGVGGVSTGQNLVRTNTDIVEKRLKDTLVYLDDVKVTKKFPSTLVITCTEAEKAADIEYKNSYYVLSASGKILETKNPAPTGDIPVVKGFEATLLWMDDSRLEVGKEYLVKLGTKKIAGVVKSIEFKTDVNTGEHLHADTIEKNEIALCKIGLSDKVVLDEFKRNKTLGELILIDRVSHMTSACGVVESVDTEGEKPYFQKDDVKVGGYVFEEFYFNLENALLSKADKEVKTYHVGDAVPTEGDSFEYPGYFDIVSLEDNAAVLIRDKKVLDIIPLDKYAFMGLPVVDERGFALEIRSNDDYQQFLKEFKAADNKSEFHNKWFKFETYRKIVCTDNFWMI